jgi:hypothetical protein
MDYASGDVVDVAQVLKVAAGVNAVSGGYLRVTTSGLIQVDLDGGANSWETLSTVNGTGAVSVRYSSGGLATTVAVNRVADGSVTTFSTSQQLADHSLETSASSGLSPTLFDSHDSIMHDLHAALDVLYSSHMHDIIPF